MLLCCHCPWFLLVHDAARQPAHWRSVSLRSLRRTNLHELLESALVGGHRQPGQCALKRAGGLGGAQGLDVTDEGAALGYDAVGEFGVGHLKIPATRFESGGGVGDRPADHNLGGSP
jgi:hypothetical protein